jgi:ribosomal 50S subunit-recycling heat shock protein
MRLDKFLKVSRLIKRRTVAKEVSDAGKITVNGRAAKASTDVKVGDHLILTFANKETEVEILQIAETMKADLAKDMYKIVRETMK